MNNYVDLARELKRLWNMKVTVMPIVVLGTVHKGLEKGEMEIKNQDHLNHTIDNIS